VTASDRGLDRPMNTRSCHRIDTFQPKYALRRWAAIPIRLVPPARSVQVPHRLLDGSPGQANSSGAMFLIDRWSEVMELFNRGASLGVGSVWWHTATVSRVMCRRARISNGKCNNKTDDQDC
jgi:hypothetical protein